MEYRGRGGIEPSVENDGIGGIPSGFTYLGQFIDHDITFDARSKLERDRDPQARTNFRTPRLDLDSLYGGGPEAQPYLYDWEGGRLPGPKLLVGRRRSFRYAPEDLPRNHQGHAITGDPRNDENLIIAQLHLLFIRFHNRVVDRVRGVARARAGRRISGVDRHAADYQVFEEAQRMVRWHYQWIVRHEFLPKVAGTEAVASVVAARDAGCQLFRWQEGKPPFMPIEFTGAAFRFGHTMVREDYKINSGARSVLLFKRRPLLSRPNDHLAGLRELPPKLVIEWKNFFETESAVDVLPSMRFDPSLVHQLFHLPADGSSLVRRNLQRGRDLRLPAGQDVARALDIPLLSEEELFLSKPPSKVMSPDARKALLEATPLWYYILCEAKKAGDEGGNNGHHLGPIGGRIVAEVLIGLLEADLFSYLSQQPKWTPELPRRIRDEFTMADLVRFVEEKQ